MLTLQEVEHGIRHYGVVELGGELVFPLGKPYDEAAEWLEYVARQTGASVNRGKEQGQPALFVFPHGETSYWRLTWHDLCIEITRLTAETQVFTYNRPAAAGA